MAALHRPAVSQALALAEIAERAASASSGASGDGGRQAILADLRELRSAAASTMEEWLEEDDPNAFWFYSALRTAGHVLSDMIDRFEEARVDPSKARSALDGLAALPEIADIAASSGVQPDIDDRDGDEMIDKKFALWDKAFATGLLRTARADLEKLGPQRVLTEHDTPETRPDIIWLAYDDDTGEMHRVA